MKRIHTTSLKPLILFIALTIFIIGSMTLTVSSGKNHYLQNKYFSVIDNWEVTENTSYQNEYLDIQNSIIIHSNVSLIFVNCKIRFILNETGTSDLFDITVGSGSSLVLNNSIMTCNESFDLINISYEGESQLILINSSLLNINSIYGSNNHILISNSTIRGGIIANSSEDLHILTEFERSRSILINNSHFEIEKGYTLKIKQTVGGWITNSTFQQREFITMASGGLILSESSNFNVKNNTFGLYTIPFAEAIIVISSYNIDLTENLFFGTLAAITIRYSENISINSCYAYCLLTTGFGIQIIQSSDPILIDNFVDSLGFGVLVEDSQNAIIRNNIIQAMNLPFYFYTIYGFNEEDLIHDIQGNLLNNKPMQYFVNQQALKVQDFIGSTIIIALSNNTILNNVSISHGTLQLLKSSHCQIVNSTFEENFNGIEIIESHYNKIYSNIFDKNGYGILLELRSKGNIIYHNNFLSNSLHGYDNTVHHDNHWNKSTEGNYWSDYNGVDQDNDGVGDEPFSPSFGSTDWYPVMEFFPINVSSSVSSTIFTSSDRSLSFSTSESTPMVINITILLVGVVLLYIKKKRPE